MRPERLSSGSVMVTRSGGGLGESRTPTTGPSASSSASCPGKSEAVWPSGPMPLSATSIVTPASACA